MINHVAVTWDTGFVMAATKSGQIHIWHVPSVTKVKVIYAHATGTLGVIHFFSDIFLFLFIAIHFSEISYVEYFPIVVYNL